MKLRKQIRFFLMVWLPRFQRYRALRRYLPSTGIFLEAGAHDGITQSNTLGLESWSKWTGILVEPIPELAQRCRKNRKTAIVQECALVANSVENPTIKIWSCGLMSVVEGSHPEEALHLKQGASYQNIQPSLISVSTKTIEDILRENHVKQLDFLSLDLEGYEAAALRGLGNFKPTFLLLESPDAEVYEMINPFYKKLCIIGNDILFKIKQ